MPGFKAAVLGRTTLLLSAMGMALMTAPLMIARI
jgi:hypothetical protein